MSLVRQVRGGEVYDSRFGVRMRGEGPFAELLAQRFSKAVKRLGLNRREGFNPDCTAFARRAGRWRCCRMLGKVYFFSVGMVSL